MKPGDLVVVSKTRSTEIKLGRSFVRPRVGIVVGEALEYSVSYGRSFYYVLFSVWCGVRVIDGDCLELV